VAHRRWMRGQQSRQPESLLVSFATSDRAVFALSPPRVIRRFSALGVGARAFRPVRATVGAPPIRWS